jgi:hypothetical protein
MGKSPKKSLLHVRINAKAVTHRNPMVPWNGRRQGTATRGTSATQHSRDRSLVHPRLSHGIGPATHGGPVMTPTASARTTSRRSLRGFRAATRRAAE